MRDTKKTKYQLRYLLKELSIYGKFKVTSSENGRITLREHHMLLDYSTTIFLVLGGGGLILNYFKNYSYWMYIIGGLFFLFALLSISMGYLRSKNHYFIFDPISQTVEYSLSFLPDVKTISSDAAYKVWCEIDDYTSNMHTTYSVTFYAQKLADEKDKDIILQMDSPHRSDCIEVGKALNRYLTEMSELKGLRLIQN